MSHWGGVLHNMMNYCKIDQALGHRLELTLMLRSLYYITKPLRMGIRCTLYQSRRYSDCLITLKI